MGYGGLQQHVVHADKMRILKSLHHWLEWLGIVALGNGLDLKLSIHQAVRTAVTFCKVVGRQPFWHKRRCQPVLLCLIYMFQPYSSDNAFDVLNF